MHTRLIPTLGVSGRWISEACVVSIATSVPPKLHNRKKKLQVFFPDSWSIAGYPVTVVSSVRVARTKENVFVP